MAEAMLAYAAGTLLVVGGLVLGAVLLIYAVYYLIFKLK